jgi:hypothetical protein
MFSITTTHLHNSSVGLRQFRCTDPCMVKYLENQYPTGFLTCDSFPDGWKLHGFTTDYYENGEPMFSQWILQYQCRDLTVCRLHGCFFHNNSLYLGVIIIGIMVCISGSPFIQKSSVKNNQQNKCMYRPLYNDYLQNNPFANVLIILLSNFTCSSSTSPNISCIIL